MDNRTLLKQLEYTIPVSANAMTMVHHHPNVAEHLPLLKLNIDFEKARMQLEGDWQFMVMSNKYYRPHWISFKEGRVKADMRLCQGAAVRLNDPFSDGTVFVMEGKISDFNYSNTCSGLLVIDNVRKNGLITDQWQVTVCLCDIQLNECEIRFTVPVYTSSGQGNSN